MSEREKEEEAARVGAEVDRITAKAPPFVVSEPHLPAALALARLAAEHVVHDDAGEKEFMNVCRAAWNVVERAHASGRCTHGS